MADPYEKPRETLLLDRVGTDGRVGRITLNRPEKLNALSQELLHELNDVLHELEADFDTRVILLRGAGRVFSAGYDLSPASGRDHDAVSHSYRSEDEQGRKLFMGTRTAMQQVVDIQMYFWNMGKVTVAQLHGFCLAGGCELAMLADLVVAADDTQIGHPGNRFGTSRTGVIWPLVLGMRQAKELYLTGSSVSGEEAERMGMINHAWPADQLEDRAIEYADYIANMPSDHLALLKQNMNRFYENMGIYSSVRSSTEFDAISQFTSQAHEFRERMAAALKEGRSLREVFEWRDGPYKDYRAAGK